MMASIKVASANVNGLQHPHKRRRLFAHFTDSIYDIIFLQETHVQQRDVIPWSSEWRDPSYWNLLFNNRIPLQCLTVSKDTHGRVIAITLKSGSDTINILNVYAPDRPAA